MIIQICPFIKNDSVYNTKEDCVRDSCALWIENDSSCGCAITIIGESILGLKTLAEKGK